MHQKNMSFNTNKKLSFINSFHVLSPSLDSLVKALAKDDFRYSSQEFDSNVLYLVKEKGFYLYEYLSNFEKFEEESPSKKTFYSLLTDRKISDKEYEHVLIIWNKLKVETIKDYHDLYLTCNILLFPDVFEKFKNNSLKNSMLWS